jgi:hypothetical protein
VEVEAGLRMEELKKNQWNLVGRMYYSLMSDWLVGFTIDADSESDDATRGACPWWLSAQAGGEVLS